MDENDVMRKYAEANGCGERREKYPQTQEQNEFRYLSPMWLNELAIGLTKGADAHPGQTWRQIPANEHAWRAIRHLILFLMGDQEDKHLVNASMRCMMAFETDAKKHDAIEWEKIRHRREADSYAERQKESNTSAD